MKTISKVSFEEIWEYLQKVISPDIDVLYHNSVRATFYNNDPVPRVSAPNHETVIGYYAKHFPERNAPTLAAIDEGYEWIWREFKIKVSARIWSLNKVERALFINELSSLFESLQDDKTAYCTQLLPLEKYGLEEFLEMTPQASRPYKSYYGVFPQQQARALKKAIWIIEEGTIFVDELKKLLGEIKPHKSNSDNQKVVKVTQAQLALFYYYCHEKKCIPSFRSGEMEKSYKDATEPYGLSPKAFQQSYNRIGKYREERLATSNRAALKAAIEMLKDYPEALALAKDELRTAETRNPLT